MALIQLGQLGQLSSSDQACVAWAYSRLLQQEGESVYWQLKRSEGQKKGSVTDTSAQCIKPKETAIKESDGYVSCEKTLSLESRFTTGRQKNDKGDTWVVFTPQAKKIMLPEFQECHQRNKQVTYQGGVSLQEEWKRFIKGLKQWWTSRPKQGK